MAYLDALNFKSSGTIGRRYFFNGGGQIIPVKETSETGVYDATDSFPLGFFDSGNINNSIINILLPKTDVKKLSDSNSKVIYIKTYNGNYSKIPLINCNNQALKYAKTSMVSNTYILNNIDVILPVYFTKDSSYGYCLKIVGDPVINKSRILSNNISEETTLYSSGYFEYIYSYASTKNKGEQILIQCPFINVYRGINTILVAYSLTPIEINAQAYGDNGSILKFTTAATGGDRYYHHFKVLNADSAGYSIAFRGYAF